MPVINYYAVLGVPLQAPHEEIKKAYRKLALQFHPDRNRGDRQAEAKIREVNAAYEILGDPEARKTYDRLRLGYVEPMVPRRDRWNRNRMNPFLRRWSCNKWKILSVMNPGSNSLWC